VNVNTIEMELYNFVEKAGPTEMGHLSIYVCSKKGLGRPTRTMTLWLQLLKSGIGFFMFLTVFFIIDFG
jgi:hypothetical protein